MTKMNLKNTYILDFWANLYEWHGIKIFSVIGGIMATIGIIPVMLNVIDYNRNQHIR